MNSPEEKARQIVDKFRTFVVMWSGGVEVENGNVKQCALICVDEIIASNPEPWLGGNSEWENDYLLFPDYTHVDAKKYWQKVKDCITAL